MEVVKAVGTTLLLVIAACLFFWAIVSLETSLEEQREEQRADCIKAGGKYAQYQGHNAMPEKDYCIK